ncbi:hypothetical protein T439DRAFT_30060 [Meredithblackwellia eburnea MCA 4105]
MKVQTILRSSQPRRRYKNPLQTLSKSPELDLIGPPCPLSNIRPTYYAPLFPSLPTSSSSNTSTTHPYSLAEFPISASPASARLQRVQQQLHAADLEWRLMRYRLDRHDAEFWSRMNTKFLKGRHDFAEKELERIASGEPASRDGHGEEGEIDFAPFYKRHLDATRKEYAKYNRELWSMQASLLWPSLKAATRKWRWKWELWRAGEKNSSPRGANLV